MKKYSEEELAAIKAAIKAEKQEWRKKNRERIKEYNNRHYLKKAIELGLFDPNSKENTGGDKE